MVPTGCALLILPTSLPSDAPLSYRILPALATSSYRISFLCLVVFPSFEKCTSSSPPVSIFPTPLMIAQQRPPLLPLLFFPSTYTRMCGKTPITTETTVVHCHSPASKGAAIKTPWMKKAKLWLVGSEGDYPPG